MAFVSAGIYTREIDLSQVAVRTSSSILGLVGWTSRGPINQPTYITSETEFINTFGKPVAGTSFATLPGEGVSDTYYQPGSYLAHAAIQYLKQGSQLWVTRIEASGGPAVAAAASVLDAGLSPVITVTAGTPGTWANAASTTSTTGMLIKIRTPRDANYASTRFRLTVVYDNTEVEDFDNLTFTTSTDANYFTTRINGVSNFISVVAPGSVNQPSFTTYNMTGGSNGSAGLSAADFIGTQSGATATGLQTFADGDTIDINMIACPGATEMSGSYNGKTVHQAGIAIAESRGDCIYLYDTAKAITSATSVRDAVNGADGSASINSSYAACYWPWLGYYDAYNAQYVVTPPSGWVAGQIALNDRVAEPWYAFAGLQRGILKNATLVEYRPKTGPNFGERELLYADGEVVNPIVKFTRDGITLWGNKTMQRTKSSLSNIHVRRLVNIAKKVVAASVRFLVFEPNDPITWRRFVGVVQPIFDTMKARRGVESFQVICDETTNPPALRDQNTMRGLILIKPIKAAEIIQIDFGLLSSGASFSEAVSQLT